MLGHGQGGINPAIGRGTRWSSSIRKLCEAIRPRRALPEAARRRSGWTAPEQMLRRLRQEHGWSKADEAERMMELSAEERKAEAHGGRGARSRTRWSSGKSLRETGELVVQRESGAYVATAGWARRGARIAGQHCGTQRTTTSRRRRAAPRAWGRRLSREQRRWAYVSLAARLLYPHGRRDGPRLHDSMASSMRFNPGGFGQSGSISSFMAFMSLFSLGVSSGERDREVVDKASLSWPSSANRNPNRFVVARYPETTSGSTPARSSYSCQCIRLLGGTSKSADLFSTVGGCS